MPNFRRGAEHIAKANEAAKSGGKGDFRPFLSTIYWKEDQESKFLLILNPLDEIPMASIQKVWTSEGRPELVVARTDDAIGESVDPLEEQWEYGPSDLNLCIAVELEPEFEVVKGRKRPSQFTVKTRTYERKVRDADGNATDEREEITTPILGLIAQSPNNFFNHVVSQDANVAPVHETAARITRIGDDKNTDYEVELFDDKELDLSGLVDFIDGVSYLNDEMDALVEAIDGLSYEEAAAVVGSMLLDKRLDEMADREYYDEIFALVDAPSRYPKKKGGKGSKGGKATEKAAPARQARQSQRRSKKDEPAEEPAPEAEAAPEAEDAPAEKPARSARQSRTSREETVSKDSPVRERLAALRAKAEAAKAEAAA